MFHLLQDGYTVKVRTHIFDNSRANRRTSSLFLLCLPYLVLMEKLNFLFLVVGEQNYHSSYSYYYMTVRPILSMIPGIIGTREQRRLESLAGSRGGSPPASSRCLRSGWPLSRAGLGLGVYVFV